MPTVAYARCLKIKNFTALATTEAHARRLDHSGHVDRSKTDQNLVSGYDELSDPLALQDAYKKRKKDAGASERKGSAIALHLLLGISPQWVAKAGDLHDPDNPRNRHLFEQARAFAEAKFGSGSVIHTRLDVDEAGGGVVDVIVVPVNEFMQRGKLKKQVSPNAGLEAAFGSERGNLRHLQTQWAEHCQKTLDPSVIRGKPRKETQAEHAHHSVYRPAAQAAERLLKEAREEAEAIRSDAKKQAAKLEKTTREKATRKAQKKVRDEWAEGGFLGRREYALNSAREEGRAEGVEETTKRARKAMASKKKALSESHKRAMEEQAETHRQEMENLQSELENMQSVYDGGQAERTALAAAMVRNQNEVFRLRSLIDAIIERVPTPIKRLIEGIMSSEQPEPPEPPQGGVPGLTTSSFSS